ncbi:MAG: LysR family transcriptional regulator [Rhodospirillales bacterium 20-60-12]|nr:MAG: LysR family transcriptional regulator [Rhodospirillales bacterium 20-60-12]HQT67817.1 LysR substrate-binding domain-containing protein [Acetobacteraceae bacterium]
MLQKIPLSFLRAFEAAGRTGSFRAAADELGLTPSAVSHAVRKLEDALGANLFERQPRAIALSSDGEVLLRHVELAFDELRRGLEIVSTRTPRLLRLHCAPSFAAQFLAPRLTLFLAAHRGIDVRLAAATDYARFSNDEFDADIIYGPRVPPGLLSIPLGPETVTALCAPGLAAQIRAPGDLLTQTLIHSDNKMIRWPDWFTANGLRAPPPHGLRFDRSFLAIGAAVDGLGVALESTLLARRELQSGRLVAPLRGIARDIDYVGHHFIYPKTKRSDSLVALFSAWLLAELAIAKHSEDTP